MVFANSCNHSVIQSARPVVTQIGIDNERLFIPKRAFSTYKPAMLFPKPLIAPMQNSSVPVLSYFSRTKSKEGSQYTIYPYISLGIILGSLTCREKVKADAPPMNSMRGYTS